MTIDGRARIRAAQAAIARDAAAERLGAALVRAFAPSREYAPTRRAAGGSWYRVVNLASAATVTKAPVTIQVYGDIGLGGVTALDFIRDLARVDAPEIELHVNSQGGDVYEGLPIYNAIREHPARVTTVVDGIAASIASVIAVAGDWVVMNAGSRLMIHEASMWTGGNAAELGRQAATLDAISDDIAGIYVRKAGGSVAYWRDLMRAETWFGAQEAVIAGLADEAR